MPLKFLPLFIFLFVNASVAGSTNERLDDDLKLLVETQDSCASISVEGQNHTNVPVIMETCHGWSVEGCGTQDFYAGRGIRIDAGILIERHVRQLDITSLVSEELARKDKEYLHLRFLQSQCVENGMEVRFSGSSIGLGAEGAADSLSGTIRISRGTKPTVLFTDNGQ